MRKSLLLKLLTFIFLSLFSVDNILGEEKVSLFMSDSEPIDSIKGTKWGSGIQDVVGMQFIRDTSKYGLTKIYRRKDEMLSVGNLQLKEIEYYFCKGILYQVNFITQGNENWRKLKILISRRFPDFFQPTEIQVAPGLYAQVAIKGRNHFNFGGLDVYEIDTEHINFVAEYRMESAKGTFAVISKKQTEHIKQLQGEK